MSDTSRNSETEELRSQLPGSLSDAIDGSTPDHIRIQAVHIPLDQAKNSANILQQLYIKLRLHLISLRHLVQDATRSKQVLIARADGGPVQMMNGLPAITIDIETKDEDEVNAMSDATARLRALDIAEEVVFLDSRIEQERQRLTGLDDEVKELEGRLS